MYAAVQPKRHLRVVAAPDNTCCCLGDNNCPFWGCNTETAVLFGGGPRSFEIRVRTSRFLAAPSKMELEQDRDAQITAHFHVCVFVIQSRLGRALILTHLEQELIQIYPPNTHPHIKVISNSPLLVWSFKRKFQLHMNQQNFKELPRYHSSKNKV